MKRVAKTGRKDRMPLFLFLYSIALFVFGFGFAVGRYKIFPSQIFTLAKTGFEEFWTQELPWYYSRVKTPSGEPVHNTPQAYPGLNLVTRIAEKLQLSAEIIDMKGKVLHAWDIDWFKLWPKPTHLPKDVVPKSYPGTHIHGAAVLPEGELVFNFDGKGLIRIDRNSNVVWRLSYRTHHSIHVHDDGNYWVCGQRRRLERNPYFPDRAPPFGEFTILEVSPRGEILTEWVVSEILRKNGRAGLLENWHKPAYKMSGWAIDDRLHLNDVEPFPSSMMEGFFKHGDVLVSLRNINTVFVFNRETEEIRYLSTGRFIHQHDPDFIDGNTFSVLDNKTASGNGGFQSRIVIVSAVNDALEVYFEGSMEVPFYTDKMGKHQWLPNGNLLITESTKGRGFEIDRLGNLVWEYVNVIDSGVVGLVQEVQRLPLGYRSFFDHSAAGESQSGSAEFEVREFGN